MSLYACGGGGGGTPTGPTKTPSNVTVGPSSAALIKVGDEQVYTATVNWSDGSQTTEPASWSSDNTGVATIDGTGKGHGVGSGEASLVAATSHGTGVLKIRVVPNYQGTWTGDYTVRSCTAAGAFSQSDWCGPDVFAPGTLFPIVMAFTQNADKISGTMTLGTITIMLDASSSIAVDGGANMSGQGTYTDSDNIKVTVTVNPINFRANGPTMTGSFTQIVNAAGYVGSVTFASDLNSVPRTASLMGIAPPPVRLLKLLDLPRAMHQK
jgi:hypothetical protein